MMNKLNAMCTKAYLKTTGFFRELKKDERGLSDAVVAVLLILVGVLAVAMLWGFLGEWIGDMWEKIVGKAAVIN